MRKMKRWKKVALWIASIVVVLGIGGIFAANYAVNKVIGSLADSLEPDITTNTAGETIADEQTSNNNAHNEEVQAVTDNDLPTENEPTKDTSHTQDKDKLESKPASTKGETKPSDEQLNGYSPEVSVKKAENIKGSVSVKDKASVTSILLKKLSIKDMKKLQQLASGGLSIEEKREARRIVLNGVSPEQYNELSQIAKKYGVSQGKTHDQVVNEEKDSLAEK
ncbi:hypothetical protein [Paenibacillus sp. CF384]|uniref:hypothetical protein n=1 Tax=Paenibacillus sp. CF384 TaxID=1884382 RepID=UPI0008958F8E|nr:hypothetical protein [Paenibacillus sp. CF384]SDX26802.1 hypothetical protein SAMN05518855_101183 [Paenibacillus sp. CF384]